MNKGQSNPIGRFGSKSTKEYRRFAQDFTAIREAHWTSIWMQAAPAVLDDDIYSVLEFGGGRDLTRTIARHFGIDYTSVDISDDFFPDVKSSIIDFENSGKTFDLVCSFQCLEHNPWEETQELIAHMSKFTHRYLYLSVPYSGAWFSLSFSVRLPKLSFSKRFCRVFDGLGGGSIDVAKLRIRPKEEKHLAHWWEVGRPGLSRKRFVHEVEGHGFKLLKAEHNKLFPHHFFTLFEKQG